MIIPTGMELGFHLVLVLVLVIELLVSVPRVLNKVRIPKTKENRSPNQNIEDENEDDSPARGESQSGAVEADGRSSLEWRRL